MLRSIRQFAEARHKRLLRQPFWRLVAHFVARVFENGSDDSGEDELDLGVGALLALLAVPGLFITILLLDKYSSLLRMMRGGPAFNPYTAALPDQYFYLAFSMAITGLVAVIKWQSIFPDRRDYMNLAPLPLPARNIFMANLIAVLAIAVLFAVDINLASSLLFPFFVHLELPVWNLFIRFAGVHALSVMLASLFASFGLFALTGLLMTVLPRGVFRAVSLYVRVAVIVCLIGLLATASAVPHLLTAATPPPLWVRLLPPVWFLGLARSLIGRSDGIFVPYAWIAVRAFGVVCLASLVFYALSYRRHFALIPEAVEKGSKEGLLRRWLPVRRLQAWFLRTPFQKAFYPFILTTLFRSDKHSLFFGAFFGLGVVLTSQRIASGMNHQHAGALALNGDLLSAPLLLIYCMILGLRFAFEVPADLRANWIHRMLVDSGKHETAVVSRKVMLSVVLPVILLAVLPVYVWAWGWAVGLTQALVMALASAFLIEFLLVKFRKIPFACSYPHWSEHTIFSVLFCVLGMLVFSSVPAAMGQWMLESPLRFLFLPLIVYAAHKWLAHRRDENEYASGLIFEDQPKPELELLNLSGNLR
jgi:hypothetical protein